MKSNLRVPSPQVSLVVPVYNGESFLPELLASVGRQTLEAWECVCVDDGSTDGSSGILAASAARDSRFRILTQPNAGVGAARNMALRAARAPFVMFADQDDLLHPRAFETALMAITSSGCDCLRFAVSRFGGSPTEDRCFTPGDLSDDAEPVFENPPNERNGLDLIDGTRKSWPIFVWQHIFRTAAVRDVPFPSLTGGEDQAWMCELSWRNLRWAAIRNVLYYNRENRCSRSRAISKAYIGNVLRSYDWILERAGQYAVDGRRLRRMVRHMRLMFRLSLVYRILVRLSAWQAKGVKNS